MDIEYIILRSKQIGKNDIIYEVKSYTTGEIKWIYKKDINEKCLYINQIRDFKIDEILKNK